MLPTELVDFVKLALYNAERYALWISDFNPIIEGVVVGVMPHSNQLLGARVYFQPPVKSVWIVPDGTCTGSDYEQKRKDQLPLTATYYKVDVDDTGAYTNVAVFANPTE